MRLVLLFVLACSPASPPPPPLVHNAVVTPKPRNEVMLTFARTPCFGTCPSYKITVYRAGGVEYVGERFVKTVGPATGHLDHAQLVALDHAFADAHFFDLHPKYTHEDYTDGPSRKTTYHLGDHEMTIEHYSGDESAPPELDNLEKTIDAIVKIEQWIGTEAEREKLSGH